ncbi:hypothetical protein ABIC66_001448 [Caulobacter sp. 1776]
MRKMASGVASLRHMDMRNRLLGYANHAKSTD